MKYVVVLLIAGGVYLTLGRPAAVAPHGKAAAAQSEDAGTDFLKAPLDRTHEVLNQARARSQDPALQ